MTWLLLLLAGYAAICLGMFLAQRQLVFVPDRSRVVPAEWGLPDFQVVTVTTADGLGIDGWYLPARDPLTPTVVLFHGNAGHVGYRADKARALAAAGYGVWLAGYRGYGGNPGEPSEAGLLADARAALDALVERGISGQRLVLYGESLGTGVAVRMATERRAGALVLEAPFTSLPDAAGAHYPWLPVKALMRDRFDSLSRIGAVQAPLLIIHGGRDRVVPIRFGKTLFAAATEPKRGVWPPIAGHNDLMAHGLMEAVLEFLETPRPAGRPVVIDQDRAPGTALTVPPSGP